MCKQDLRRVLLDTEGTSLEYKFWRSDLETTKINRYCKDVLFSLYEYTCNKVWQIVNILRHDDFSKKCLIKMSDAVPGLILSSDTISSSCLWFSLTAGCDLKV